MDDCGAVVESTSSRGRTLLLQRHLPGAVSSDTKRMHRRFVQLSTLVFSLAAGLPATARADIYLCRDAHGTLTTSDRLTSDCLRYGGKVLGPNGTVRRVILSPEEQKQADLAAQAQRQAARDALARQREDRSLLLRFPDRPTFDAARAADLSRPASLVTQAEKSLVRLRKEREKLDSEAQFYPKGPLPLQLRTKFEENRALAQQEHELIASQHTEMAQINAQYDALLKRMQPLWAQGKEQPPTQR